MHTHVFTLAHRFENRQFTYLVVGKLLTILNSFRNMIFYIFILHDIISRRNVSSVFSYIVLNQVKN